MPIRNRLFQWEATMSPADPPAALKAVQQEFVEQFLSMGEFMAKKLLERFKKRPEELTPEEIEEYKNKLAVLVDEFMGKKTGAEFRKKVEEKLEASK